MHKAGPVLAEFAVSALEAPNTGAHPSVSGTKLQKRKPGGRRAELWKCEQAENWVAEAATNFPHAIRQENDFY